MSNNGPNYQECPIEIGEVHFDKKGILTFDGLVNHELIECEINAGSTDFEKILPKINMDFEYFDEDGCCSAWMDIFNNLHWLVMIKCGNMVNSVVHLEPIIKDFLYNQYLNK